MIWPVAAYRVTRGEKVNVGLAERGLRCPCVAFHVYLRHLEIMGGFGKGKTHELDVDRKLLWPMHQKMGRCRQRC